MIEQRILELETQVVKLTTALNNVAKQLKEQHTFNANVIAALKKICKE